MPTRMNDFDRAPNRKRESYRKERRFSLLIAAVMIGFTASYLPRASDDAWTTLS